MPYFNTIDVTCDLPLLFYNGLMIGQDNKENIKTLKVSNHEKQSYKNSSYQRQKIITNYQAENKTAIQITFIFN